MFKKTLRRLSMVNSVVFLLIFLTFGAVLYGYVSYRLFDNVDDAMRFKATSFKLANGRPAPQGRGRFLFDPRIIILLREADGRAVSFYPIESIDMERLTAMASRVHPGEILTSEFEDHDYRIITVPYEYEDNVFNTERGPIKITDIIAVSIVDSEMALLRNLLIIIVSGLVIGMLIIILAGYYLARKAMIPIQDSWEKQQQFVADASHELRTPLAVIKSNAELVLRHPSHTIEEESIRVTNIVREVRRMTKLVASLLTLARSDANQDELQLSPISLDDELKSIAEQFIPLAEMDGLTLKLEVDEQLELTADRERLHQLVVILLDNALKYTPSPGDILISGSRQGNNILLFVEDSGEGIPPEDLPRVFDRFYRGDKARSRQQGGTGLGLAIAKWIVEKHGGKINVESTLGIGTKFSVILPVKLSRKKQ